ncbi:MBL fold metallo-hydrolase [Roseomonas rosulenta]|uniref:MBL fold metallo-hydrolase n=1 Tax=Roseomonas rosulenta TaxID=2748667 RepID=UPI0034E1CC25
MITTLPEAQPNRNTDVMIHRRIALLAAGSSIAAPALLRPAAAQAPAAAVPAQAPGFYRFRVGTLTVTVVHDGFFVFPNPTERFVRNATPPQVEEALRGGFLDAAGMRSPFNVTFIESPRGLIAFDVGTGGQLSPQAGTLVANMHAAGLDPARVNMVAFTHFHADHISGLTTAQNEVVFPNAEIVVPEAEWAFWMDDGAMSRAPEAVRGGFMNTHRRFGPYAARIRRLPPNAELMPGIASIATFGHTPGHTSYLVADGADQVLVMGDVTNRPEINLRHPDWHIVFDMDPATAVVTRRRLLDRVVADRIRTIGYHWPFPANGFVAKDGEGYRFAPADWSPVV